MNQAVGEKNCFEKSGGGNDQCVLLQGTSSGNLLGALYRQLSLGLKYTRSG